MAAKKNIPSVERAMKILELFLDGRKSFSIPEIVDHLNLPRSTAHELVRTLVNLGYLSPARRNSRKFALGLKVFELGGAYASNLDLAREGQDIARAIATKCGETVHVGILENTDIVYIAKVDSIHRVRLISAVGRRIPAHLTALGKMLLSALSDREVKNLYGGAVKLVGMTSSSITTMSRLLDELATIRRRGVAFDNSESTLDVQCVAAPVFNHEGKMVAAMSISVPITRMNLKRRKELTGIIGGGAAELSAHLGYYQNV